MKEILTKILAFLLRIKSSSVEDLERKGKRLLIEEIKKIFLRRIGFVSLQFVYSLGAIEYSTKELEIIRMKISNGIIPDFSFPQFDESKDYIDFYYIETFDSRCFIIAIENRFDYMKSDQPVLFVEINNKLEKERLEKNINYLE